MGRAQRVPIDPGQNSGAAVDAYVAPAATAEVEDHYEDEVDQNQNYVQPPAPPPPGRPHAYHRNGRAAPPLEVHDHLPKLKLNIPPFEGRYVPDIYLTWELETEQRFTCLQYPRRDGLLLLFVLSLVLHVYGGLNIVDYILFQLLGLL